MLCNLYGPTIVPLHQSPPPGFPDAGAYWRSSYDVPTFEDDVMGLWAQLKPLYEQLHGYVRRKLRQHYGADKFPQSGHIPAHLLGWFLEIPS